MDSQKIKSMLAEVENLETDFRKKQKLMESKSETIITTLTKNLFDMLFQDFETNGLTLSLTEQVSKDKPKDDKYVFELTINKNAARQLPAWRNNMNIICRLQNQIGGLFSRGGNVSVQRDYYLKMNSEETSH